MRILIAGEFSGRTREAFAAKGHHAWSVDIEPTEVPGNHFQEDWWPIIEMGGWDLIIFHPVCTKVCVSGNSTYAAGKRGYAERLQAMKDIPDQWDHVKRNSIRAVLENPRGVLSQTRMGKPSQRVQPWWFGTGEIKETCLWFWGDIKPLWKMNEVAGRKPVVHYESPGPDRSRNRSRTDPNIAKAYAEAWG